MISQVKYSSDLNCHVTLPFQSKTGVVKIRSERGESYVVGWNGSVTPESLYINETFAKSLGLGSHTTIEEVMPRFLPLIEVDPLSEDHWEMIEGNSGYLEENILSQIRVVQSGLLFPLWIRGSIVWVKVQDMVESWGVIKEDSQVAVKPKERPRKVNQWLLRNIPLTEDLVSKDFIEGSLLACRRNAEIFLGISHHGGVRPQHISWKVLQPFLKYEVAQVFPVMDNKPTLIHKVNMHVKKANFRLKVYCHSPDVLRKQRIVLFHGLKTDLLAVEIDSSSMIDLQEWLPYIVVNPNMSDFSSNLEVIEDPPLDITEKLTIHTDGFVNAIQNLIDSDIGKFFSEGLPDSNILLQGSAGSGKSVFVEILQDAMVHHYIATEIVHCNELSTRKNEHRTTIQNAIARAIEKSPCVLVLEDAEKVFYQTEDNPVTTHQEKILSYMRNSVFLANAIEKLENVKVLLTTSHESSINKLLLGSGRWKTISVPTYSFKDMCTVLSQLLPWCSSIGKIAAKMKSFQPTDVFTFCRLFNMKNNPDDLEEDLQAFVPQSLESKPLEDTIEWSSIGGLHSAKKQVLDLIHLPTKFSILFKNYELKQQSGLLLYGPPGCGKTLLGRAIPSITDLSYIYVKGPELLNKYIGASEQSVRELFSKAKRAAPSIIFIDEFEAIGARRGSSTTGVTDRIVNQFLCELDGVESRSNVYVVGASSRPEMIDPALLRPGRLDLHVYVGFPNGEEREEILKILLEKIGIDFESQEIPESTQLFTGADIRGVVNNLQIKLASGLPFNNELALQELKNTQPSFSLAQIMEYEKTYKNFKTPDSIGQRQTAI